VKPSLLAYCLVALSAVSCGGAADIPETPDLRQLLQDYERPTAVLDVATVTDALNEALNEAPNLKELAAGVQAAKLVLGDVNYASKTSSTKTGSRVRLQGSLGVRIRCPGERTDPMYDESVNGSLSLTLAVAENQILRSIGGQASDCVFQGALRGFPARIQLDGDVAFDLGGDIGIGQPWSGELLATLPGELTVAGIVFKSISARLHEGRFQHLVTLPSSNKTVVLELSEDAGITIRDGSGVWFCAEGQSCARR
jgi:hypothetical protein